jgi:molybdopterin converting factor small subunit
MKITVKYSGHFSSLTGKNNETVKIGENETLDRLFDILCGEYNDLAPLKGGTIYLVNGKISKKERVLTDGDEVKLFQMMAGG